MSVTRDPVQVYVDKETAGSYFVQPAEIFTAASDAALVYYFIALRQTGANCKSAANTDQTVPWHEVMFPLDGSIQVCLALETIVLAKINIKTNLL